MIIPLPYQIIGAAGLALALTVGGFFEGTHIQKNADLAAQTRQAEADVLASTKAAAAAVAQQTALDQVKYDHDMAAAKSQQQIKTVIQKEIHDVPQYITVEADNRCIIPFGLVRLLNAAASGSTDPEKDFPNPAGVTNDTPTAIDLTAVSTSIVQNYGQANADRQQLIDLQNTFTALRDEFNKDEQ